MFPAVHFTLLLIVFVSLAIFYRERPVEAKRRLSLITIIDAVSVIILFYCFTVVIINYLEHGLILDLDKRSYFKYNLILIGQSILFYTIGRIFLGPALRSRIFLLVFWFILVIFILVNIDLTSFGLNLESLRPEEKGAYLSLASMFALYSIVVIAVWENSRIWWYIAIISLVTLFLLHSRGAFIIFLLAVLIGYNILPNFKKLTVAFTFSVILIVFALLIGLEYIFVNERMVGIVVNPFEDPSFLTRILLAKSGLDDIVDFTFRGRYGGQIEVFGYIGYYIHNILSYWRQFGLIPFILVIISSIYLPWRLIHRSSKGFLSGVSSSYRRLLVVLFIYCVLSIILAKAFEWYFLWLYVGYASWIAQSSLLQQKIIKT